MALYVLVRVCMCTNGGKTFQSVLVMGFMWQSPAFCGVPGPLWGESQVQTKSH